MKPMRDHNMERTAFCGYFKHVTLEDLDNIERLMSKEELLEMKDKLDGLMNSLFGIPDVQTRALMEQSFKRGYLAAHFTPGNGNLNDYKTLY
jgi:hypothetical protein